MARMDDDAPEGGDRQGLGQREVMAERATERRVADRMRGVGVEVRAVAAISSAMAAARAATAAARAAKRERVLEVPGMARTRAETANLRIGARRCGAESIGLGRCRAEGSSERAHALRRRARLGRLPPEHGVHAARAPRFHRRHGELVEIALNLSRRRAQPAQFAIDPLQRSRAAVEHNQFRALNEASHGGFLLGVRRSSGASGGRGAELRKNVHLTIEGGHDNAFEFVAVYAG
ncbi:hypothetical protein IY145_17770 [Methylosinus sp. H3A]|uniref:hypothetical protein n=1 Tax=Methylosinus sp. H3A TaxID=2785786 RepID=UPI0018C20BB0|nr:hypothetical protein [Methylosinus sp. H3A]MBG0811207.1 hypothetical protein [Methylosinus sp. H3A]